MVQLPAKEGKGHGTTVTKVFGICPKPSLASVHPSTKFSFSASSTYNKKYAESMKNEPFIVIL